MKYNRRDKKTKRFKKRPSLSKILALTLALWLTVSGAYTAITIVIERVTTLADAMIDTMPAAVLGYSFTATPEIELIRSDWPDTAMHNRMIEIAEAHGADPTEMDKVINCETAGTYDPDIQSWYYFPDGTREESYGLAQIFLPAHPQVSIEEAKTPEYALTFMAQHFAEGNQHLWSCWKKLKREGKL